MAKFSYFGYQMQGVEELKEALGLIKDLPTEKRLIRRAMAKSLEPMAEEARRLVPVKTGTLRDTIVISHQISKAQARRDRTSGIVMYVGSNWPTAHLVEFGTKSHVVTINKKRTLFGFGRVIGTEVTIPDVQPKPFLRPAFESKKQAAVNLFGDEIWKAIEKLATRLSKQAARGKLSAAGKRALGLT